MPSTAGENGSAIVDGAEVFELVDGDTVADVRFESGTYTLKQIVERVNAESKTTTARVADGKIRLKVHKLVSVGHRTLGISSIQALEEPSETTQKPTQPSVPGNRHERRKSRAQAQRAATQKRIQGR